MRDKIGIIIAMDKELKLYLERNKTKKISYKGKDFYSLKINKKKCIICLSGIGKVNAAYATTLLIEKFKVKKIISTGISGGLGVSKILDIVISSSCVQHDVDTTQLGDPLGFVSTVRKVYFEADEELIKEISDECKKQNINVNVGIMACGEQFVASKERIDFIRSTFNACSCDMESGAIAQVAYIANIPFVAIRCISDNADEDASISFIQMVDIASEKIYNIVSRVI
ncbi:MAG: 5'-methylthioadenosine/adenosylhomocysteine nucleosidase [Clostridia bacterium]|nr:5'-methylthioadenosine/adenosylhomocysteine nucleosidase [Clostridia bacterium]